MPGLNILISGGGVAGTSLAFWLSRLPITTISSITLVEHYPSLRTTGLQIDLRGHGIQVLRHMGLEEAFRSHSAPEDGMQFIDMQGRRRAYFPANKSGKGGQGITSEFEIMRGDLTRLIHDATSPSRARWLFGTSIASFSQTHPGGPLEVTFKSGEIGTYDLLIGADGVWSKTRRLMLGDEAAEAAFHPIGEYAAYMTFARAMKEGEGYDGQMYISTQKRSMLLRRHDPETMQLYLLLNREDDRLKSVKRGDVEEEKRAFAEIYADDSGWRVPEMMKEMFAAEDFYCERLGIVKLPIWSKGRVTLLGDSAFAPGGSGMGTTCAIVGAYVLAGEIGKHCAEGKGRKGVESALKAYEETYRPYMDQVQKGLEDNPFSWLLPTSAWGVSMFHWIVQIVAALWVDPIMRYFMKETNDKWRLPEYEELRVAKSGKEA